MDLIIISKSIFALIVVIIIIIVAMNVSRKLFSGNKYLSKLVKKKKIALKEIFFIDQSSKIIEITRNGKNYLILIGKNNEILLDSFVDDE